MGYQHTKHGRKRATWGVGQRAMLLLLMLLLFLLDELRQSINIINTFISKGGADVDVCATSHKGCPSHPLASSSSSLSPGLLLSAGLGWIAYNVGFIFSYNLNEATAQAMAMESGYATRPMRLAKCVSRGSGKKEKKQRKQPLSGESCARDKVVERSKRCS